MLKPAGIEWHSWLQPLREVHMQPDLVYDRPAGNPVYLYGCAAVALIILIIACINYMNLATARATRRARSVGFRKILGASRLSLALQFLGEAMLFALFALVLALVIVEVVLKLTPINTLMDGKVSLDLLRSRSCCCGCWLRTGAWASRPACIRRSIFRRGRRSRH